eukprot:1273673-Prymnesium_polylepis.1
MESKRRSSSLSVPCSKCDDALFTSTSIVGNVLSSSSTAACTDSAFVRSHATPRPTPPASLTSSTACSTEPGPYEMPPIERAITTTFAPPRAIRIAIE